MSAYHPSTGATGPLRLYGRRVLLRPLTSSDFTAYSEVRRTNHEWLVQWEPARPPHGPDPFTERDAFTSRCATRDRERQVGNGYAFGLFVDNALAGEINVNNIQRGPMQSCTIGYWVDRRRAGHAYVPEGVVVAFRFAFEELLLHRVEVCIIPRNARSRRVMEKLAIRDEGVAERYVEIAGVWEDHVRYAITAEEWAERREEFAAAWL